MKTNVTILIGGMTCGHCVKAVAKTLKQVIGVESANVTLGKADVRFDQQKLTRADLERAVEEAGYEVSG